MTSATDDETDDTQIPILSSRPRLSSMTHGVLPHRQLFRAAARDRRRRRGAARAADVRLCRMGGAARGEPRLPHALGADLAGRRSDPRVVPPPHQALLRGPAQRPRLSVLHLPQARQRSGRRPDARQYPPRLRPGRQPRLLDGRGACAAGLHDGGGQRASFPFAFGTLRLHRIEAACIPANVASIRLLERPASGARALPGNICASTGSGRTTCCMPASRTTRFF